MNLPKFSVNRPVTILMLFITLIVIGIISYQGLGLDLLPDLSFPVSAIIVSYPGVAPEEIETLITIPLEEAVSTMNQVDTVNSYSQEGSSIILLSFQWGTNMDIASLEIREKIDMVKSMLPSDASDPIIFKADPSMMPMMILGMGSEQYELNELEKFAQDIVKPRLERLEGIAQASVSGGLEREILVSLNSEKIRANQLTLDQIVMSLRSENINLPAGTVRDGTIDLLIRTLGRFESIEDIRNVVITNLQGNQIYLKDIAQITDTFKEKNSINYINGLPSVAFSIQKESGANTVIVANRINHELKRIEELLPGDIQIINIFDSSDFIKKTISEVTNTLLFGAVLAILVLYLFLRSISGTIVIGLAIPISVISTFTLLYFSNLTLNMMTLGGLALGIGMLVDNGIVVSENIYRQREIGKNALLASQEGANEVSQAITASTLTTIAVFLPVAYVSGIAGELFKSMGLTITFSLLMSLFVALTLIPMLSSKLIRRTLKPTKSLSSSMEKNNNPANDNHEADSAVGAEYIEGRGRLFNFINRIYGNLIRGSLRHRGMVTILAVIILIISFLLVPIVGTEFFPSVDQGSFNINISLPVGTNLEVTRKVVEDIERTVSNIPEVKNIFTGIGGEGMGMGIGGGGNNSGSLMVSLTDQSEREREIKDIIADLRSRINDYPDTKINIGEQGMSFSTGSPLSIKVTGDSIEELGYTAKIIIDILSEVEGIYDLKSSVEEVRPELHINIDREKANLYGLSAGQIATNIQDAILGKVASYYQEGGDQFDIRVSLDKSDLENIQQLENLYISSGYGLQIPLKEIAEVVSGIGPQVINRENQQRIVTVTGNISGRFLGNVIQDAQKKLEAIVLPEGYNYTFAGENQEMIESFQSLFFALILSIFLVYMIIAAQFESLLFPFAVILSVPFSLIGVILALLITDISFNVLSFLGLIMLAGIVVNNAIVLIDYINQLRKKGLERNEAVIQGGKIRLRPILMTTLTTVLAMLPMAIAAGEGAEMRAPMAVTIIGGLTSSTFLTLIVVPIFYTYLDDLAKKLHIQF
ncbi:MAG: efflux RND transporter permease subunit [Atribacterota bacterium]|nr:efflux RND transporter permease subunit [Atribacterota bacterium]MDD4895492.1 efflux RND transporter permease subunit [Atribacterota bacterium]MDD5637855.1 efflux RND transporter permease subunit [Atribacterota bacterium]